MTQRPAYWLTLQEGFKELVLIVVSILIAVAINSWNDERKQRLLEIKVLRELRNSLKTDIADLEGNYQRVNSLQGYSDAIRQFMAQGLPYRDSLPSALLQVSQSYSFFVPNRASFESLKARGLDIISNDSLRLRIITLYEITYKIVERSETRRIDDITAHLNYYGPDLLLLAGPVAGRQKQFEVLLADAGFKRFLFAKFTHDKRVSEGHSRMTQELAMLIKALEAEIHHLE